MTVFEGGQTPMKITAKITDKSPSHTRLSIWVNGGLICNPGWICLRNEEVVEFLDHLKLSSFHIKAKIREMIEEYKTLGEECNLEEFAMEKRIALTVLLEWIEKTEMKLNIKLDGFWEVKG